MKKLKIISIFFCVLMILSIFTASSKSNLISTGIDNSDIVIDGNVITIRLSETAISGYILVLLADDPTSGWDAGIMLSLDVGEIVHYKVGNLDADWNTDVNGSHHVLSGDIITFTFPELGDFIPSTAAVLTILSGSYDWIPNQYQGSPDFIPFEKYMDGWTTTPGGYPQDSSGDDTSTTFNDDQTTTAQSTEQDETISENPLELNFSIIFALLGITIIGTLYRILNRYNSQI